MSQSLSELLNSLQQNGFLEFIKQVKLTVKGLEEKIKADFQKNNRLTNLSDLEKWVRLENIIKMYHVCTAYANGNLLYEKDPYHPASLHDKKQESYGNWSTLKQLEAVRFFHPSFGELKIAYSYAVTDDCNSPSSVLENLLFSHTIMECRASVQIAYYLTLLDLLKMLFHPEKGKELFDNFFRPKPNEKHNFNRLRIGNMGLSYIGDWYDFSPIFFLANSEKGITLEELKKNTENYIGLNFYIYGNKDYIQKHPGWHILLAGKNQNNELLFLAAGEIGQKYLLSYNELLSLLKCDLNKSKITSLSECRVFFDMEKLNSCISNPKQFLKDLTTFCSNAYERNIIPVGYHSVLNQSKQPYLRIKTSRDETDPTVLGLQKNNFRPDLTKYFVKDDMFIFKMSPNTSTEKSQKYDRPITENQNYGVRFFSSYSQKPISQFMLLKYYRDLIDKVFPVELVEKDASVQFCRGFNLLVLEAYAKKSYLTLECLKLFLDKNIFKQELEEYTNVNKMLDHEDSFNLKASP